MTKKSPKLYPLNKLLVISMLASLSHLALAEDVIEKVNGECPRGYSNGPGKYCYNRNSYDTGKVTVKSQGECPSGYSNGQGQYCYGDDHSKDVIEKSGDQCPRGYRDGRGHYCYKSR